MNKNKYILLGAVVLGLGLTSCSDFLNVDRYFRDQQSTERIFSDKDYTLQWLSFCYSRLQGDNLEVGHSDVCPFNFSDDQVFNERGDRFAKFKRGEYLNSTGGQNAWKWSYDGIYQASILLNELYENEDLTPEEVTDIRGQARFLRAYFCGEKSVRYPFYRRKEPTIHNRMTNWPTHVKPMMSAWHSSLQNSKLQLPNCSKNAIT